MTMIDMTIFDRIKELCEREGLNISVLEKELKYGNGSLSKVKKLPAERVHDIASFFNVSMEYLLTGESKEDEDNSDIERTLEEMLSKLERQQTGLMYHGEPIDDRTRELLYQSLQNASNWAKKQNELDKK